MIAYFPDIYEDELLYSLLARFYVASGYTAYRHAAEELFLKKKTRINVDFVNAYTPDAIKEITRNISMEQIVLKHTMFPYYGRFLPRERRESAFRALINMTGNYHKLLPFSQPQKGVQKCLRYCPICASFDRKRYGEAYWRRSHQIPNLSVCPAHKCYLSNSNAIIANNASPSLKAAEDAIPFAETPVFVDKEIEIRVAEYMEAVFQANVDMESTVTTGAFFNAAMENTEYLSARGDKRNMTLFYTKFKEFYKDFPDGRSVELWRLQKIITGFRINFFEICLIAMFLNIPVDKLTHMTTPEKSQQELFDEKVCELHKQGFTYLEIAKALNVSRSTVLFIAKQKRGTHCKSKRTSFKGGVKSKDWSQFDADTLPLVKEAIKRLRGGGVTRPKRVTVSAVEKMLNLPNKKIRLRLPRCLAEIQKHEESQQQHWARETVWAVRQIMDAGDILKWYKVMKLTHLQRKECEACLPYIRDYADDELTELIIRALAPNQDK